MSNAGQQTGNPTSSSSTSSSAVSNLLPQSAVSAPQPTSTTSSKPTPPVIVQEQKLNYAQVPALKNILFFLCSNMCSVIGRRKDNVVGGVRDIHSCQPTTTTTTIHTNFILFRLCSSSCYIIDSATEHPHWTSFFQCRN